jgi:multidrug efflux pump
MALNSRSFDDPAHRRPFARVNISAPFILRPIATALLALGLLLLGLVAYGLLPIAALPQIDFPTIQVVASLPGASAETMSTSVSAPLERQLSSISGVTDLTSTSSLGSTSITVQFDLGRDINSAAQDVQAALNAASGVLPKNMPNPPGYRKVNPADFTILSIAVTSDTLPIDKVDDYADNYVAQQLSRIRGVGLVDLNGEQKPAVRVRVNPAAAAAMGLSLEDIRSVLAQSTVNAPKGTLDGPRRSITVNTTDQVFDADTYKSLIVAYHNGAPVRIADIGTAINGVEDVNRAAWAQGRPAVVVDVHKQPGFNVVETVERIKARLPEIIQTLPPSVHLAVVGDRTQVIRASVSDIEFTLMLTVGLVVLVVFLFLRSFWATLIPSVAIPLSIIGAFGALYVGGYSIDNLSLMGLAIAVGFVVDDAIVMIEYIMRRIEGGEEPLDAALNGSRQIGFTIVSMTISLLAVFIPLLLMNGIVGRLFREFAVTVSVAVLVSAVISLTLTPTMCALFLAPPRSAGPSPLSRLLEAAFDAMQRFYERGLRLALAHRRMTLAIALATVALNVCLYALIPKGFFPQQDTGLIIGNTDAPEDISYPAMAERSQALMRIIMTDPDIDNVYGWIGPNPSENNGRMMINLKPFNQRRATAAQIMERLRIKAAALNGISLHLQSRQDVQVGGRISRTQYQFTLEDPDLAELNHWAPAFAAALAKLPQLQDVASDLQISSPEELLTIDRDAAARLGVNPQVLDDTLYDALGQRQVATIFSALNQYHVVLEVSPDFKLDAASLGSIYVPSSSGRQISLSSFTRMARLAVPLSVNHQDQFPAVTISFNLAPGAALGDAVAAIQRAERDMDIPASLRANFQGSAAAFKSSLATEPYLIAAAIIAVYIVLGVLYESFIHPLTILSTLPSAGVGALAALILCHKELSVMALIGIILLIGIVKKNAIMMIDFALDAERNERKSTHDAIYQAALVRFRPIMMTTMAALLGGVPLALGTGAGSELRSPLGVAIVGGLLVSQILTLYTTPVIYLYLDPVNRWFERRKIRPNLLRTETPIP